MLVVSQTFHPWREWQGHLCKLSHTLPHILLSAPFSLKKKFTLSSEASIAKQGGRLFVISTQKFWLSSCAKPAHPLPSYLLILAFQYNAKTRGEPHQCCCVGGPSSPVEASAFGLFWKLRSLREAYTWKLYRETACNGQIFPGFFGLRSLTKTQMSLGLFLFWLLKHHQLCL